MEIDGNSRQLQTETLDTCGYFCLMFLHYMSVSLGIEHFLENFSSDLRKNDQIVRNYVSKFPTTIVPRPLVNPYHQYGGE